MEYGKNLRGIYTNKDTGAIINLSAGSKNGGVKEILQHDYKDIEHLQNIAAIPQIIENSIFIERKPNEDNKNDIQSYDYYVIGLKIGDIPYTVKAVVGNAKNGNRYYDHKLTQIEKGKLLSTLPKIQKSGEDNNALYVVNDKRLLSILQDNESNFDEENDIRFSTSGQKQSAADLAKSGKAIQDDGLFEMLKTNNYYAYLVRIIEVLKKLRQHLIIFIELLKLKPTPNKRRCLVMLNLIQQKN